MENRDRLFEIRIAFNVMMVTLHCSIYSRKIWLRERIFTATMYTWTVMSFEC